MKAYKCDGCGEYRDGVPPGGVVTRDGVKDSCSPDCSVRLMARPDVCTLGQLEEQRRAAEAAARRAARSSEKPS